MWPRKTLLVMGAGFIAFHLAAMLLRNAPFAVRDPVWPLFGAYADGLRMADSFGVFARYTSDKSVVVQGVTRQGERLLLSHSSPAQRKLVDARITKIQRRFIHEDMRELYGRAYLAYFCRAGERAAELERVELELQAEGAATGSEVVLGVECRP